MNFSDIFAPLPAPLNVEIVSADSADNANRTFNAVGDVYSVKGERKHHTTLGAKAGLRLSALSAPEFVPLDVPFAEGHRYRMAGATELRTRLDLYVADPAGPWVRKHGVLMALPPTP